ncbi:mutagen-sensitive 101 isoform X2 [Rhynchophorus ferrugineus]|uniref:mutagen-sensitive 101 isoform X2 n=1 Tax=Rhynchophorus ferrugineus TaxID=354439 RepID=UPI003FCDE16B
MSDIHIVFILPEECKDESEASPIMKEAFNLCMELVNDISWQKESELDLQNLTKLSYIVFEDFGTRDFSDIIKTKSAVVGPKAISVCLSESKPIPSFQWPILNVTMYDCVVTCSHLSKIQKESIKNKVQLMGGFYTGDFLGNVTHLICDGSTSEKYLFAAEKGIKLMLPNWIDYLWQESQQKVISTNDSDFLEKFKCPIFHKQIICTTGISSRSEKVKLQELITANGGEMVGKLNLHQTHVLICHGTEGTTSEKFKAAKSRSIPCVTTDWLFNSVEKGYSLPYKNYQVKAATSTPTKDSENVNPNFSCISSIGILSGMQKSQIDETMRCSISNEKKRKASEDLIDKIDMKRVKGAGSFLDGCSIFVAGFNFEQRDKLNKAINLSGATRYDSLSDRVTHVIVGDPCCAEVQTALNKKLVCTFVSVQWLLDSIEQQRPAKEEDYAIYNIIEKQSNEHNISSPVNKKALNILRKSKLAVENVEKQGTSDTDKEILGDDTLTQQYLGNISKQEKQDTLNKLLEGVVFPENKTLAEPEFTLKTRTLKTAPVSMQSNNESSVRFEADESSSQVTTGVSANVSIFCSYTFVVANFDEETTEVIEEHIEVSGGTVIKNISGSIVDYLVVPILKKNKSPHKICAREIVNELFIIESIEEENLVNLSYYHRPIDIPSNNPLKDCVVTISAYTGQERHFLKTVIEGLGGVFQEQFSRRNIPSKNVLASTHLVLPTAEGKKYEAAIKWKLPVVNKEWLLQCVSSGSKVHIDDFLVDKNDQGKDSTFKNCSGEGSSSSSKADQSNQKNTFEETPLKNIEITDNVSTPTKQLDNKNVKTPLNQIYQTPETYSQVTPLNKILQDAIANKILPTPSPKTYYPWDPKTPDTPIGAFIRDNPSPALRKEMQKYVDSFPEYVPPKRRLSTPLSELRKRLRNKVLYGGECNVNSQDEQNVSRGINDSHEDGIGLLPEDQISTSEKLKVGQKLQQLQDMVMASGSGSGCRRPSRLSEIVQNCESPSAEATIPRNTETNSQVYTVDWDYGQRETESQAPKVFLLSGIELNQRERLSKTIKTLGGIVSESASYDDSCTHLICPKPLRNEKTLACMAAGKWILHVSYIEKSQEAGRFLFEEHFEFGNPLSRSNINYEEKDCCINYWRKEIKKRGYGAFNGMRAIVIAERRDPLVKVIEAGEGVILNISPPFEDSVHATHCLLEAKVVKDLSQYTPLALQGIKCVNTIYINEFLRNCGKEVTSYVLPYFSSYYSKEK